MMNDGPRLDLGFGVIWIWGQSPFFLHLPTGIMPPQMVADPMTRIR